MSEPINIMTPKFFKNFTCVGGDCEDHCCHSWTINVNKKSYKQLRNTSNKEVQQLAIAHFKLTKNDENNWAYIQMSLNGNCPVLDNSGLCTIQKNLEHKYLPFTCQDYPRLNNFFGLQLEPTLFISCPTAAQSVLFDRSAMTFESNTQPLEKVLQGRVSGLYNDSLPYWATTIRDVCFQIILDQEATFEERIFSLGLFLKQAETRLDDQDKLSNFIDTFIQFYNEKSPHKMYDSLPSVANLKWQVFSSLDNSLIKQTNIYTEKKETKGLSTSAVRFQQCRDHILSLIENDGKPTQLEVDSLSGLANFERSLEGSKEVFDKILSDGTQKYLTNYFKENGHIWTNYALYYIYHHQFLINKNCSLFEFFKVMATDIFMLKSYLSAIALNNNGIDEKDILKLFQSYARRRQHGRDFITHLNAQLRENQTDSAGAIFGLLKSKNKKATIKGSFFILFITLLLVK